MDHLAIRPIRIAALFGDRPASDRQAGAVDMTALNQRANDDRRATNVVDILGCVRPTRAKIADQGRARKDLADIVDGEGDTSLVGDCRQVQD